MLRTLSNYLWRFRLSLYMLTLAIPAVLPGYLEAQSMPNLVADLNPEPEVLILLLLFTLP